MNATFTPFRSARGLLLLLLMLLLGSSETWAQAPTNFDVVSIKRHRPLDQAVEYVVMFKVLFSGDVYDNVLRDLGDSDFRLITTGTATGTFGTIRTIGNEVYVNVKNISGTGTLGIDYTGRTKSVYTGGETYESVDKRPVVLSITRRDDEKLWGGNRFPKYLVIFSEPVTGVDIADFSVALNRTYAVVDRVEPANGTNYPEIFDVDRKLGDFAHREGSRYIVTVGPVRGEGTLRLDVNATGTGIVDVSGNNPLDGGFTTGESYYYDGVSPTEVSIKRQAPATAVTGPGSVTFRVTFSEAVQRVDDDDFGLVATGTVAGYRIGAIAAVSASVYDVTVNGITGEGTLRLRLWPGYSRRDLDGRTLESLTLFYKVRYGGIATIYDFSSDILFRTNPLEFDRDPTEGESYTISSAPVVASINPTTAQLSCANSSVRLTASAGSAYLWSTGATTAAIDVTTAGTYSVTVTNSGNTAVASAEVTGNTQVPTASINPGTATLNCTTPLVSLTASGGKSYRWDDNSTSAIRSVSTAGTYSVTVTAPNNCTASATTTVATTNDSPLVITSQPASASTVEVGATATARVTVSGTGPVNYQWFKNNTNSPVDSQNSTTFSLSNLQLADAGRYFIVVTGPCNTLTSDAFVLTVNAPNTAPVATTNPSQTATVGERFFCTVLAFTDPEGQPLTYAASVLPDNGLGFNPAIRSLTGTPRSPGVSTVTLTATDPGGLSATTTFTITVNPPPVVVTPLSLNVTASPGLLLTSGTTTLSAAVSGGTTPYSYTFSGPGTITPNGNTASVSGLSAGVQTFTVQVADATSPTPQTTTGTVSMTVNEPAPANQAPTTSGIANQMTTAGQSFSLDLAPSFGDPNGDALSFTATNLPAGLSLAGTLISGTPSMSGVSNVTVRATDPGSLSVSTTFIITISPAPVVVPPPTATFSITGVTTVSCATVTAGQRMLVFTPRYAGLSGLPVTFRVLNESLPTTQPGPYTLRVYTDNPTITLKAIQSGTPGEVSFSYHWLGACNGGSTPPPPPTNQAPATTGIANQNGTAGQNFGLNLASSFADPNGDALTYSASGLPAGLSLSGTTISGTPSVSGVSTVTVTATDPGGLTASTQFSITVNPVSVGVPPTAPFSITGVTTVSCQVVSGGERRLSFTPRYAGLSGQPVTFRVLNESLPTTQPGPYTLRVYTDNPTITLKATQTGTPAEASFSYHWLAACTGGSGARVGTEPVSLLKVQVLGNPVQDGQVSVEVRGAAGDPLRLSLTDTGGKTVGLYQLEVAGSVERHRFAVSRESAGLLLLRVSTPTQSRTLRVLRAD